MNNEQTTGCSFSIPGGLKIPAAAKSHSKLVAELNFGEEVSENKRLSELLRGKTVAEFGCGIGLRTAYLASHTNQIFGIDPDGTRLELARQTLKLNNCDNTKVLAHIAEDTSVQAMILDTRRYCHWHLPNFKTRVELIVVVGPLSREAARKILEAGYQHLPEFTRAAAFVATWRS